MIDLLKVGFDSQVSAGSIAEALRVHEHAALRAPVAMQRKDQVLKAEGQNGDLVRWWVLRAALAHRFHAGKWTVAGCVHTSFVKKLTGRGN